MNNRIKSFKFCHFIICGLAVLCCSLLPSSVGAVDMSPNAYPIWANANPTCSFHHFNSNTWVNNSFSNNSTGSTVTSSVDKINCDYPNGLSTKNTYAVYSFRFDNFAYDNSADSGWLATKASQVSGDGKFGVIGQTVSSLGSTGWQIDIYLYGEGVSTGGGTFQLYNPLNNEEIFYIKPQERVTFVGASYWRVENQTNYLSILNDIYDRLVSLRNTNNGNQLNILNVVNDIDSKLDTLNDGISDLKSAQEQANEDAQDRYDAEKQEESDREDSISDSSDDAQGLFSFSVFNPFSGIFDLFKNDCSANIPILASWLHAPSSTYTSWWCPIESEYGVRSYLTPVFGISSMMLLFGFVVRWLSNNSGDIYGARNFNKEMNG